MVTLEQSLKHDNEHGTLNLYLGKRGKWYIARGQSQASDVLERCNFEAAKRRLDAAGLTDHYAIERMGHWLVGWTENLLIDPDCPEAAAIGEQIEKDLEGYPVLDDDLLTKMEDEAAELIWSECFDPSDRIEYLRSHAYKPIKGFRDLRAAVLGDWEYAARYIYADELTWA